jgi:ubiquinone/menaquinone biosynthesis C-methylase UbiE
MDLGFRGEVADFYQRYRRGYPGEVIDAVVGAFGLGAQDLVVDLGCGTGQLTVPMAGRVRAVVGVDPEPDMLVRARRAAAERGVGNASWVVGADSDMPALRALLGDRSIGAVTIGQALHWMDHEGLFRALAPMVRPGGGVAVMTNGRPLWLQDSGWSRALLEVLAQWWGTRPEQACGTDEESQRRYRESLAAAGFRVGAARVEYSEEVDLEWIVGGVYSALSVDRLPGAAERGVFAERVRRALEPHRPFVERVEVGVLIGWIS